MFTFTSHRVEQFDIKLLILVIYVLCYVRDAVVLIKCNFTGFAIHLPDSGVLSDSAFVIFDLFDDIELFVVTSSMHSL